MLPDPASEPKATLPSDRTVRRSRAFFAPFGFRKSSAYRGHGWCCFSELISRTRGHDQDQLKKAHVNRQGSNAYYLKASNNCGGVDGVNENARGCWYGTVLAMTREVPAHLTIVVATQY